MNAIQKVEDRFLPSMREMYAEISTLFPQVNVRLTSFQTGQLTDNVAGVCVGVSAA